MSGIIGLSRCRICMYDVIAYPVAKMPCRQANPGSEDAGLPVNLYMRATLPTQIFAGFGQFVLKGLLEKTQVVSVTPTLGKNRAN